MASRRKKNWKTPGEHDCILTEIVAATQIDGLDFAICDSEIEVATTVRVVVILTGHCYIRPSIDGPFLFPMIGDRRLAEKRDDFFLFHPGLDGSQILVRELFLAAPRDSLGLMLPVTDCKCECDVKQYRQRG